MRQANELAKSISVRKATEAFARICSGRVVVEAEPAKPGDERKPTLLDVARRSVFAGALAAMALSGATPAVAAPSSLNLPTVEQAKAYLADASKTVTSVGDEDLTGGIEDIVADDKSEDRFHIPKIFDGPCTVGFAPSVRDVFAYHHLDLPPVAARLAPLLAIKGITHCLNYATKESSGWEELRGYYTEGVNDVASVLAAAKYGGKDTYRSMLELEMSSSLGMLMAATEHFRADRLVTLDSLGRVGRHIEQNPEVLDQLRSAGPGTILEIARSFVAHSEMAVKGSSIHPDALYHIGQDKAAAKLTSLGFDGAAWAAGQVAGLGLVKDDFCDSTFLDNGSRKRKRKSEGNRGILCPLRATALYGIPNDAEIKAKYGADATAFIGAALSKPEETAALKR